LGDPFERQATADLSRSQREATFEGCEPSMLFREFAAECAELAQGTPSPEKRTLYLKMAQSLASNGAPLGEERSATDRGQRSYYKSRNLNGAKASG